MLKIGIIVTDNTSAWNFRRGLLKDLVKKGYDTCIVVPSGEYDVSFNTIGARHIPINVYRYFSPLKDIFYIYHLYKTFRAEKFDIVHNISVKPNIYGAFAAWLSGIPLIVGSVTGRGNVFLDNDRYSKLLRPILALLYRFSFKLTSRVWFQNAEDINYFISCKMLDKRKAVLIPSSGVDLIEFSPSIVDDNTKNTLRNDLGISNLDTVVVMVSRALWTKGIKDFIDTSKLLLNDFPEIKFILIGNGEKGNPLSVPDKYLLDNQSPNFKWLGWRNDVKEILSISDIVLLLSKFGEGLPRSLLEGMAMGKPVIATNVIGCRDVVEKGKNGFLVDVGNINEIAALLINLSNDPETRSALGSYSRKKVEIEYDINYVNRRIISDLYGIGN